LHLSKIEVLMPLPKIPTKPAALLSPRDYPKAAKDKIVKPLTLVERASPATTAPVAKGAEQPAPVRSRANSEAPTATARKSASKTGSQRKAAPAGPSKLFVLDTNVLMHDPTALFRFAEHDVYLPMITLE